MNALKNIDTAYKFTKNLTFFALFFSFLGWVVVVLYSLHIVQEEKDKIYVLINNKALEIALLKDVDINRKAEIKNHSELLHQYFFELDPDMETITKKINRALILGDDNLRQIHSLRNEKLYYHNLVEAGISTEIICDSVIRDVSKYPYRAIFYGRQRIIRSSNITVKEFISSYKLRNVKRTDNNPHGLYTQYI